MVKASDLKAVFGPVTNRKPLYLHDSVTRNQPVAGIKSNKLKFSKTICGQCNHERTQPHDRAWERLSGHLRARQYHANVKIRLEGLFPGRVQQSMLEVHLFFVKIFECHIVEHAIPIEIGAFSTAILGGKINSALFATRRVPLIIRGKLFKLTEPLLFLFEAKPTI